MDPWLQESNLRKSLKKYFVDNLQTIEDINVYFDRVFQPTDNAVVQWICVVSRIVKIAQVCEGSLTVHMFTKRDREGDVIVALRDTVMDYLLESFPFYDTDSSAWELLGRVQLYPVDETDIVYLIDNGKLKTLEFDMKWSAVY